jgi:uroporphyrinogen decarboxylase
MNPRERVLATIRHEEPDCVPLFFNSIDAKLLRALGIGTMIEAWTHLDVDIFVAAGTTWCEGKATGLGFSPNPPPPEESLGGSIRAGWNGIDEFGRIWKHGRYVGGAVETREDLRRYAPDLKLKERYSQAAIEDWKENHPDRARALFSHLGPMGLTVECMGLIHFCYALADDRALIRESIETKTDWFIETAKHAVAMGMDFVVMGDDMGFKHHGFVSPSDFKDLAFSCYQRIVTSISVPVFWHSEGYIRDYLPAAVEAGIQGVHGIEGAAGMDLGEIKREFGEDLVLIGNVDANQILCQSDIGPVRAEVDRCLREGMAGGGFVLSIAGSAHEGVNPAALVEMCRYARAAGVYGGNAEYS